MKRTYGVIGGDRRQACLAELLAQDGAVATYGLGQWNASRETPWETVTAAEVVILPLPLCRDGLLNCAGQPRPMAEVWASLSPGQLILAGQISPEQTAAAAGLTPVDYFLREELLIANAAITAEGAIQTAMAALPRTLWGSRCLILGCGRIGRLLAMRLAGLGAEVWAAARKPSDWAWIRAAGWHPLDTADLREMPSDCTAVFNTVPSPLLGAEQLRRLPRSCLCVDLASQPGIDARAAETLGLRLLWARGLPGKTAPETAAAALRETILQILRERGDCA